VSRIVLLAHLDRNRLAGLAPALGDPVLAHDLPSLEAAISPGATLLSYGTSVIVPAAVLDRFEGRAYNLHAASPDYPGRDPHHFAVYDAAARYGATLHRMTPKVDDGPIVDVELFDTPPGVRPSQLLALANAAALRILLRSGPKIARGETLEPIPNVAWGSVKRSRKDFLAMCRIDADMSVEEFERRFNAFDGEAHDNLYIELHGRTFRLSKPR
jgi:methionyl-tRNA formyltransferase